MFHSQCRTLAVQGRAVGAAAARAVAVTFIAAAAVGPSSRDECSAQWIDRWTLPSQPLACMAAHLLEQGSALSIPSGRLRMPIVSRWTRSLSSASAAQPPSHAQYEQNGGCGASGRLALAASSRAGHAAVQHALPSPRGSRSRPGVSVPPAHQPAAAQGPRTARPGGAGAIRSSAWSFAGRHPACRPCLPPSHARLPPPCWLLTTLLPAGLPRRSTQQPLAAAAERAAAGAATKQQQRRWRGGSGGTRCRTAAPGAAAGDGVPRPVGLAVPAPA